MFVVDFPKMGPEHRALAYSTFRFIPSSLAESTAVYTLEEMCGLNLLYEPRKNVGLGTFSFANETKKPTYPLVPSKAWNKK